MFPPLCNVYLSTITRRKFLKFETFGWTASCSFCLHWRFNAHSPLWDDVRQDFRGQIVQVLLNDYNLCLLNTGKPTYRHHGHHHSFSVPDLFICDPSLALELYWLTYNDLCGSDHFPVILKTSFRNGDPAAETLEIRQGWLDVLPHSLCVAVV